MVFNGGHLSGEEETGAYSVIDGTNVYWRFKPSEQETVLMAEINKAWVPLGRFPLGPIPIDLIQNLLVNAVKDSTT